MSRLRRPRDGEPAFAWPPTREDLELIEVVDADTLRPVHARCDEPEPARPELLKPVPPVRPAVAPIAASTPAVVPTAGRRLALAVGRLAATIATVVRIAAGQLDARGAMLRVRLREAAAELQLGARLRQAAAELQLGARLRQAAAELPLGARLRQARGALIATVGVAARQLSAHGAMLCVRIREAAAEQQLGPRLRRVTSALSDSSGVAARRLIAGGATQCGRLGRVAAELLQLGAPLRLAKGALIATSGVLAITTSAYLSLRPSPSTVGVEPVMAARDRELPPPLFTVSPLARLDPMEMSWWLLPAEPSARPVSRGASAKPVSKSATKKTRSVTRDRRTPVTRLARTASVPPTAARLSPPLPPAPSPPTLMARAPVVSNVENMKPSNVQTVASVGGAGSHAPDRTPPAESTYVPRPASVPRPAGTPPAESNQQIYAAIHQYERAYDRLDANAVHAVWPSVDARALERAFRDLRSQTLEFDRCDIDVASVRAKAACRGRATYETRAGEQAARTEPRAWTFTLQKNHEAWHIVTATANAR